MSSALEKTRVNRFRFLRLLYEKTGGNKSRIYNMWDLGSELGLDREETDRVAQYLQGEGLLEFQTAGGGVGITHFGIKEIEEALSTPEQSTRYFPPAMNIIHIGGDVVGSQLQVGTQTSQQIQVGSDLQLALSEFLSQLEKDVVELKLAEAERRDLSADVETIKAQLKASRPKHSIIKEALSSIKRILEGVGATLLASKIAQLIMLLGGSSS